MSKCVSEWETGKRRKTRQGERDSGGQAQKNNYSSCSFTAAPDCSIAPLSLRPSLPPSHPSIRSRVTGLFVADVMLTKYSWVGVLSRCGTLFQWRTTLRRCCEDVGEDYTWWDDKNIVSEFNNVVEESLLLWRPITFCYIYCIIVMCIHYIWQINRYSLCPHSLKWSKRHACITEVFYI